MIPGWVAATVCAALFQCWRTALQQRLRGRFSLNGAAVVRYLYGVPVGATLLLAWIATLGSAPPLPDARVLAFSALGGIMQILGTNALISSFGPRGFAVGTAYSKTEAIQAAVLGAVFLGIALPPLAWAGIALSVTGVVWLSLSRAASLAEVLAGARQPAALFGLAAAFCFALSAFAIREAALALGAADAVTAALSILLLTNTLQTLMQGGWLLAREPDQARAVLAGWRIAAPVGVLSAFGSGCWFLAFTLAPIALVRAVGQVEIVFTLLFGRFYLGERTAPRDVVGALLVVSGVLLVLLGAT
jgi:drug/metabolite transporter (DMT)-like permease